MTAKDMINKALKIMGYSCPPGLSNLEKAIAILAMAKRLTLAQDTIAVALNMAGYDIGRMSQFEKAHALMDMAMELKARKHCTGLCDKCPNKTLCYDYIPDIDNEDEAFAIAQNFGRVRLSSRR